MFKDAMTMGQAGLVCIASMLVVFAVLLILYVVLIVFGKIATRNAGKTAVAAAPAAAVAAPPKQDDTELLAVLSAAIAAYEQTKSNPFIRNQRDLD